MAARMTLFRRYVPRAALATPLVLGLLAGCAGSGSYPSLGRRPQEQAAGRITDTLPAPAVTIAATEPGVAPAVAESVAALRARATAAHDRFTTQSARDARAIRAGRAAASGSEAWAQGTAALGDLTGAHDATVAVLAELDGLYADQRIAGGDAAAIGAVRDQVAAWVTEEEAALAALDRP